MKQKADREDILIILNRRIRELNKKVFCKHHKLLLERSYDGMTECPKDTQKCSACLIDELSSWEEVTRIKEAIQKRDFYLRTKQRRKK